MPDIIDATGLQVKTASEITAELKTGLQGIYGSGINLESNSPDGQMVGIITQEAVDLRELAVAVNSNFDPDQAEGTILDERVAINNIQRQGGTYTVQPIDITVSSTVTLAGLDTDYADPNGTGYTIQDDAGNQFILITTATLMAGSTTADFRAKDIGPVRVPVDTITNPVTIVLGVDSVNNSLDPTSVGLAQETDAQLRTRRQQSVANASSGYLNGLRGDILALAGVSYAELYENTTNSTDANGIPAHSIWLIVAGGADADIAATIYAKKSYGCSMKGAISVNIVTASGAIFTAKFDNPTPETLYLSFSIQTTQVGFVFDTASIAAYIAANAIYGIGSFAETSQLTALAVAAIAAQGGGGVPVLAEISHDDITFTDYLTTTGLNYQWALDAINIDITVVP